MATVNDILAAIGQKGAVAEHRPVLTTTKTRFPTLNNEVLRLGGVAGGRIYELYAPASAGKSTLSQIICADYQREGKIAVYFDAEATTQTEVDTDHNKVWMENLGVNRQELIMPNFGSAEDLFEIVKSLVVLGANIICIDTVAVLQPEAVIFREEQKLKMNESTMLAKTLKAGFGELIGGFAARKAVGKTDVFIEVPKEIQNNLWSHGVKISDPKVHKLWYYDCAIIGVNHAMDMIGVMYGDPTYTPGGKALGFQSSIRLGLSKPLKSKEKAKINGVDVPLYRKTTVVAAKNKLAAPFGEMGMRVYYDGRVEEDIPLAVLAEKKGLIEVTGRTVTILVGEFEGEKMNKGKFEEWVGENPEFLEEAGGGEVEKLDESELKVKVPLNFKKDLTSKIRLNFK